MIEFINRQLEKADAVWECADRKGTEPFLHILMAIPMGVAMVVAILSSIDIIHDTASSSPLIAVYSGLMIVSMFLLGMYNLIREAVVNLLSYTTYGKYDDIPIRELDNSGGGCVLLFTWGWIGMIIIPLTVKLWYIVIPIAIIVAMIFGLMYTIRRAFKLQSEMQNHENNPNAHKE